MMAMSMGAGPSNIMHSPKFPSQGTSRDTSSGKKHMLELKGDKCRSYPESFIVKGLQAHGISSKAGHHKCKRVKNSENLPRSDYPRANLLPLFQTVERERISNIDSTRTVHQPSDLDGILNEKLEPLMADVYARL